MPWKASLVMEERLRFVARLLDGEAMTDVCRDFCWLGRRGFEPPHQESCPMGLWLLCGQQIVRRTPQQARARSATLLPMARRITLQITSRQFHLPHP